MNVGKETEVEDGERRSVAVGVLVTVGMNGVVTVGSGLEVGEANDAEVEDGERWSVAVGVLARVGMNVLVSVGRGVEVGEAGEGNT